MHDSVCKAHVHESQSRALSVYVLTACASELPCAQSSSYHMRVTIPALAAYYAALVSQVLAIRERTP
eukprot:365832-Chlamydomonas_euryale.AAC.5